MKMTSSSLSLPDVGLSSQDQQATPAATQSQPETVQRRLEFSPTDLLAGEQCMCMLCVLVEVRLPDVEWKSIGAWVQLIVHIFVVM